MPQSKYTGLIRLGSWLTRRAHSRAISANSHHFKGFHFKGLRLKLMLVMFFPLLTQLRPDRIATEFVHPVVLAVTVLWRLEVDYATTF